MENFAPLTLIRLKLFLQNLRQQQDNANFATNDLFIKNCDVILVCADVTSRMTVAGNLTINVFQLLQRNPHIPSMLVLTKTDRLKYRTNYKFQNLERQNARMLKLVDILDKITEGNLFYFYAVGSDTK